MTTRRPRPLQRRCRIEETAPIGAYTRLRLQAPDIAARARPGQFVAVAVGDATSSLVLRRAFALYQWDEHTLELVVDAHGAGTHWLTEQPPGVVLDVVGPLGRPYPDPAGEGPVVVVGGGYGAATLVPHVAGLRAQGRTVTALLGAGSAARLVCVAELEGLGAEVLVATDDGSAGTHGRVTDLLGGLGASALRDAQTVYACGPMRMLAATADAATRAGVTCWCSVEEAMACGIGVCMTCVLPVVDDDGATRMLRSCVAGPTFDGSAVRWSQVGTIPADCVGAAPGGGH